jgi:hypothetical protein
MSAQPIACCQFVSAPSRSPVASVGGQIGPDSAMRRVPTPALTARHAPPARQRVAVSRPVAGVLAAVVVVLVVLACPINTPIGPGAGPPIQWVVSGSLAAFQLAVLPPRDLDGGVVTANRPNPAPTAVHALLAGVLTASGHRRRRGRPPALWLAWRPSHRAAGGPRAPPTSPRPS